MRRYVTGTVLQRIRKHAVESDQPHVMIAGTIHQSKGGEWNHVVVAPDVMSFAQNPTQPGSQPNWLEPWKLDPENFEDASLSVLSNSYFSSIQALSP